MIEFVRYELKKFGKSFDVCIILIFFIFRMQEQSVNCLFFSLPPDFAPSLGAFCSVLNQGIKFNSKLKFVGSHMYGKSNNDVTSLYFIECRMTKIPQKLTETFPNLKKLVIFKSKLRTIKREDLKEYEKLEKIIFCEDADQLELLFGYISDPEFYGAHTNIEKLQAFIDINYSIDELFSLIPTRGKNQKSAIAKANDNVRRNIFCDLNKMTWNM